MEKIIVFSKIQGKTAYFLPLHQIKMFFNKKRPPYADSFHFSIKSALRDFLMNAQFQEKKSLEFHAQKASHRAKT